MPLGGLAGVLELLCGLQEHAGGTNGYDLEHPGRDDDEEIASGKAKTSRRIGNEAG